MGDFDAHPNEDELRSFWSGTCDDDRFEHLAEHLEACPRCAEALAAFDNVETDLVGQFREACSSDKPAPSRDAPTVAGGPGLGVTRSVDLPRRLGNYELRAVLGSGSMGVVYDAWDSVLGRKVAVKEIAAKSGGDPVSRANFEREAQAIAKLDHPNIVRVYQFDEVDGRPFCVMEYVEGRDLSGVLGEGELTDGRAAELVRRIAIAAHYAHEQGVLHRDLKPSNVLIGRDDGVVKVVDFGLAQSVGRPDLQPWRVLGTPAYMPPEQASGRADEVGPQSDVFAIGAILYEMLTGRPPFDDADPRNAVERARRCDYEPAMRVAARKPDLAAVCDKCLRLEPEDRYRSAAELADDLRRHSVGLPVSVRRGQIWKYAGFAVKRKPLLTTLVSMVLALAGWLAFAPSALPDPWASLQEIHRLVYSDPHAAWERLSDQSVFPKADHDFPWRFLAGSVSKRIGPVSDAGAGIQVVASPPGSAVVASGGSAGEVRVREATGAWRRIGSVGSRVTAITVSEDDRWVVAAGVGPSDAGANKVRVVAWQIRAPGDERRVLLDEPEGSPTTWQVNDLSVSRAHPLVVAACSDGKLRAWRLDGGGEVSAEQAPNATKLWCVRFIGDRQHVVAGGEFADLVRSTRLLRWRWDPEQGMRLDGELELPGLDRDSVTTIATGPGALVASGTRGGVVSLWKAQPSGLMWQRSFRPVGGAIESLASTGAPGLLVAGVTSTPENGGRLLAWDRLRVDSDVVNLAQNVRATAIASARDGVVMVADSTEGSLVEYEVRLPSPSLDYASRDRRVMSDGGFLESGAGLVSRGAGGTLTRWDASGNPVEELASDARVFATAAGSDTIVWVDRLSRVWRKSADNPLEQLAIGVAPGMIPYRLALASSGDYLAMTDVDGGLSVFDLRTGQQVPIPAALRSSATGKIQFAGGRPLLLISQPEAFSHYDCLARELVGSWKTPLGEVLSLSSSPDGAEAAAVVRRSDGGGDAVVYGRASGEVDVVPTSATGGVACSAVAVAPEGGALALGLADGEVVWWRGGKRTLRFGIAGPSRVTRLRFSTPGTSLLMVCQNQQSAWLWSAGDH